MGFLAVNVAGKVCGGAPAELWGSVEIDPLHAVEFENKVGPVSHRGRLKSGRRVPVGGPHRDGPGRGRGQGVAFGSSQAATDDGT